MKLLLQCPQCKNKMQYQSRTNLPSKNSKQCVYCGRSFKVGPAVLKNLE